MASLDIGTEFFFCVLEGGLDGSETGNVGTEVVETEKNDGCDCEDDGKLSREDTQGCKAVWCSMVILGGVGTGPWTADTEEVGVKWGVVRETAIVTELVNKLDPEIQMGRFG